MVMEPLSLGNHADNLEAMYAALEAMRRLAMARAPHIGHFLVYRLIYLQNPVLFDSLPAVFDFRRISILAI